MVKAASPDTITVFERALDRPQIGLHQSVGVGDRVGEVLLGIRADTHIFSDRICVAFSTNRAVCSPIDIAGRNLTDVIRQLLQIILKAGQLRLNFFLRRG